MGIAEDKRNLQIGYAAGKAALLDDLSDFIMELDARPYAPPPKWFQKQLKKIIARHETGTIPELFESRAAEALNPKDSPQ